MLLVRCKLFQFCLRKVGKHIQGTRRTPLCGDSQLCKSAEIEHDLNPQTGSAVYIYGRKKKFSFFPAHPPVTPTGHGLTSKETPLGASVRASVRLHKPPRVRANDFNKPAEGAIIPDQEEEEEEAARAGVVTGRHQERDGG